MRDGAPAAGSDFTLDDYKTVGFNGSLAKFLGHRKVLALVDDYSHETRKFRRLRDASRFPQAFLG
jgi:hypothetical protein